MALFNKDWLEYVAKVPKGKPYMSMEEFIKSRMGNSAKTLVEVGKYNEEDFIPTLIPFGKVSFHQWEDENSDEVKLLTKSRYRRPHDYDMWIDLDKKVIYVENGENNGYFKSESEGIYQALGERYKYPFDVKFYIPRNEFNLKMEE